MGIFRNFNPPEGYAAQATDLLKKTILSNKYIPHTPTPKQAAFVTLPHLDAFYGGQAGGGKSDALLMSAVQFVDYSDSHALLLRRSYADLALPGALMDRAHQWWSQSAAHWDDKIKRYTFPGGATISFGYLEADRDKYRYQSAEFTMIGMDEATQFEPNSLLYMFSRLRKGRDTKFPTRFRAASNPGNIGHDFIKHRYIDPGIPGKPFVPASLSDNPYLDIESYRESLSQLDKVTRMQLEEGIWDDPTPEGSYFGKFLDEAEADGRITNVPYEPRLPVKTYWDLGIAKGRDSMVIWFVQDDGLVRRVIDVFGASGEGFPYYAGILKDRGYVYGAHFAPHDIRVRELGTGKSRQETALSLGIRFAEVPDIGFDDGINATRQIFRRCYFDRTRCSIGLQALRHYKKEWDEKGQMWKANPVKDWTNDYCDGFRMFAVADQDRKPGERKIVVRANYDHFRGAYGG